MQIIYVSRNFTSEFGENASAIISKNLYDSQLFKENTTIVSNLISSVFQQQIQKTEDILLTNNEKKNWWNLLIIPETDPISQKQSVLIVLREINEQKFIEEKFIESEQRYEMAIEAADLGIWDYMVGTGETFYSRKWKAMLGYYPDELPDQHSIWEELLHPDDKTA